MILPSVLPGRPALVVTVSQYLIIYSKDKNMYPAISGNFRVRDVVFFILMPVPLMFLVVSLACHS